MKRFTQWPWIVVVVFAMTLYACAYVNVKTPLDLDLDQTDLGTKVGTAEAYSLLWLVAWGDASYAAAARNGGIKVIKHADQEIFSVLGIWTTTKAHLYGE